MSSGRFFAVQDRDTRHPALAWGYFQNMRYSTAEEAIEERNRLNTAGHADREYRAVEVHVTTEISVVE
jgi:hypothetical protein